MLGKIQRLRNHERIHYIFFLILICKTSAKEFAVLAREGPDCHSSSSENDQCEHAWKVSVPPYIFYPITLKSEAGEGNTCLPLRGRGWALYWRVEYSTAGPMSLQRRGNSKTALHVSVTFTTRWKDCTTFVSWTPIRRPCLDDRRRFKGSD